MSVLTWSIPDRLDPTHAYYVDTMSILSSLVTRSLTQYVWNPDSRSMMLIPDIATDLDTSNADFTEWTFTIRDGVRFEDDAEVTAEDVAFGIKRSFDRDAFKSGATYSNDYFLNGDTYKGPYRSGTDYPGVVVSAALPLRKRRQPSSGSARSRSRNRPLHGEHSTRRSRPITTPSWSLGTAVWPCRTAQVSAA